MRVKFPNFHTVKPPPHQTQDQKPFIYTWTLGDKIGVFNEKFNLKATLEIRSFYFQTFSEIIYVLLKLYIFAKIFLHSTTIPTYITNNNRLAADVSSIPKDKWFVVGKSFLKIN